MAVPDANESTPDSALDDTGPTDSASDCDDSASVDHTRCQDLSGLVAVHAGDVNRDLWDDIVYVYNSGLWCASLNQGGELQTPHIWLDADEPPEGAFGSLMGDVDGDSRDDVLWAPLDAWGDLSGELHLALSTGDAFAPVGEGSLLPGESTEALPCKVSRALVADVDGDGRGELVVMDDGDGNWCAGRFNEERFSDFVLWTEDHGAQSTTLLHGDVDGDGCEDLGAHYPPYDGAPSYVSGDWQIIGPSGSTGCSPTAPADSENDLWVKWIDDYGQEAVAAFLGDVDGDRRADAIWTDGTGEWTVGQSTGTSFDRTALFGASGLGEGATFFVTGDFNADRHADVAQLNQETGVWSCAAGEAGGLVPEGCL
ncbi:MAG: VCBS repeat-containing protein [Alphaproteobacteria bacterium]|nr:VCBS repeat-containing protein [Alphaproteobacteria bacterium]